MRKFLVAAVAALSFASIASADTKFNTGDYALTLSGSGTADKNFDDGNINAQANLSYFLSPAWEVNLRQGIGYNDNFVGSTTFGFDFNFNLESNFVPYVGANLGFVYGGEVDDTFVAGPEAGVRYFVNDTTFIQANIQYEFDIDDGFDEGAFGYGLGIGFRW